MCGRGSAWSLLILVLEGSVARKRPVEIQLLACLPLDRQEAILGEC